MPAPHLVLRFTNTAPYPRRFPAHGACPAAGTFRFPGGRMRFPAESAAGGGWSPALRVPRKASHERNPPAEATGAGDRRLRIAWRGGGAGKSRGIARYEIVNTRRGT
jgi:hypothetical protein